MDVLVCIWLSQQGQAEGTEIGPEKEVEGMKCVSSSTSMLLVVLSPKLSLRGQFHSTVIKKSIMVDGGVILQGPGGKRVTWAHAIMVSRLCTYLP